MQLLLDRGDYRDTLRHKTYPPALPRCNSKPINHLNVGSKAELAPFVAYGLH